MSEFLVPFAISSQLDVTGEERIHAARYVRRSRTSLLTLVGNLSDQALDADVDYTYTVVGGTAPIGSVAVVAGALPTGLSIDSNGVVSGTATTEGAFSWTLQVTDAVGTVATLEDSAVVDAPPRYSFLSVGATANKVSDTGQPGTWTNTTNQAAYSMCASLTNLVVLGDEGGNLYYSTDGMETVTPSSSGPFVGLAFLQSNGVDRVIAVCQSGGGVVTILDSSDGVTWTLFDTFATPTDVNDTAYGNNTFVIATSDGIWSASEDDTSFTHVLAGNWTGVGFNGVGFLIGENTGATYEYSVNGTSWAVSGDSTAGAPYTITGAPGYFVIGAFEDGIYRTTDNGATIIQVLSTGSNRFYSSAVIDDNVVLGSGGGGSTNQYASDDAGQSFSLISPAIADTDICVMVLD